MDAVLAFIKGLFSGENGTAAQIVSIVLAVNIALTGIKAALDSIKDKTATSVDNSAADFLGKALGVFGFLVDMLSANKEHK